MGCPGLSRGSPCSLHHKTIGTWAVRPTGDKVLPHGHKMVSLADESSTAKSASTIDRYERAQEVRKLDASPPPPPEAVVLRTQPWQETPDQHLDAISGTIFRELAEMDKRRQHLHSLQPHLEGLRAVLLLKESHEGCPEDVEGVCEESTCAPFTPEPIESKLVDVASTPLSSPHATRELEAIPHPPFPRHTANEPENHWKGWKAVLHGLWAN